MSRMIPHALAFSFAALCGLACPAPSEDECGVGTEGCACTPGGSCDPGLTCASQTCVDFGSGSDSDAESGDASAGDDAADDAVDDATSSDDAAPESSSGGVDECIEHGGTRLENGYCYKQCTHDEESPGEDLFEDCAALSMVCRNESTWGGQDFCFPANATCTTDADCDTGLACVHTTSDFGDDYCEVPCDAGGDCPETMRCVTSCQGGYFIDLYFCAGPFGWPAASPEPSVCG